MPVSVSVLLLPPCRDPHLHTMTYAPQAAGGPPQLVQQAPNAALGRLKLTVSQVRTCELLATQKYKRLSFYVLCAVCQHIFY